MHTAGFDAIGMRFFRSPGLRYGFDPRLFPYTQIRNGYVVNRLGSKYWQAEPHSAEIVGMGDGQVPLAEILDILPAGLLSLEWPMPKDSGYSPAEWAKHALDGTRLFLDQYYAAKN